MKSFSHPDFTVGSGISPDRALRLRALPPVWNFTMPRRLIISIIKASVYTEAL
jgi:hypothetical protein